MASKLNFRARTLDASKPMAIYNIEDLPELTDLNAINRSVPAMPSGMEKEEESEKHLQDILDAQSSQNIDETAVKTLVIPTPEVFSNAPVLANKAKGYKIPRQYIHVQPFSMDAEKPDYDVDEEDDKFVHEILIKEKKFDKIDLVKFEEMIDQLEKNCTGHSVISAQDAKLNLKGDDDLIFAVYDYWVEKRLRFKQPLLPSVKSDKRDIPQPPGSSSVSGSSGLSGGTPGTPGLISGGSGSVLGSTSTANLTNANPYIAFRRRTEKMQTRKNRKNDEASYEKMLKLRRDLSRAVVLLEMVKRREKTKKEYLTLTAEIFDKRYTSGDYEGKVIAEVQAQKPAKVLQPNQYFPNRFTENWIATSGQVQRNFVSVNSSGNVVGGSSNRDKKSSKKRKRSGAISGATSGGLHHTSSSSLYQAFGTPFQSDDDQFSVNGAASSDYEDDPQELTFAFRRKANVQYLAPKNLDFEQPDLETLDSQLPNFNVFSTNKEPRHRYTYGSLSNPYPRFLGRIRRRVGRGGRHILDRMFNPNDQVQSEDQCSKDGIHHFRPVTPPHFKEDSWDLIGGNFGDSCLSFPSKPVRLANMNSASLIDRQRSISSMGGVKTVSVDSVGAHNAASALVTNNLMDIFGK